LTPERLLIVYNAEAGIAAGIRDSIHKLLKPETYPCSLCALTHGVLREDPAWKQFLARMPLDVRVYHRPDFRDRYPDEQLPLPAVLVERGREVRVLIGADELKTLASVDALTARIGERLSASAAPSA
jgi:hypothetical protein